MPLIGQVKHYEDLRVWQDGVALVEAVYALCAGFPKSEIYGLASQLKRAAVSIPSNIAEGSARNGTKELIQFVFIARGSLAEVRTQILLAKRLKFIDDSAEIDLLCTKLARGLTNLISSLRK